VAIKNTLELDESMTRRPQDSSLAGRHRQRDARGKTHGPYQVFEYVGANPLTSIYLRSRCIYGCGHVVTCKQYDLTRYDGLQKCGGCKRMVERREAAE